jgi:hypothetical protein
MITLAIFFNIITVSSPESHVPEDVLVDAGYQRQQRFTGPRDNVTAIYNDPSGRTLRIGLDLYSEARPKRLVMDPLGPQGDPMPALLSGLEPNLPTGLPLGFDQLWRDGDVTAAATPGSLQVMAKGEREYVIVTFMEAAGADARGNLKIPTRDRSAERELVQRVARHLMARAASRRLEGGRTVSLAGKQVLVRRNSKKSFDHVALDTWASARGWTLNVNPSRATAALTKGSRMIIVPLGSGYVKVDSEWRDAGDLVAEVSGKWFVPLPLLEAAQ